MKSNNLSLKNQHEKAICQDFLNFYNQKNDLNIEFTRYGKQEKINEPDCICTNNINIEIVTVFYNEEHAELDWKIARNQISVEKYNTISNDDELGRFINPDQQAFDNLLIQLNKKNQKLLDSKYIYDDKIFLVIDCCQTDVTDIEDYLEFIKDKKPDFSSKFDEVWLRTFKSCYSGSCFLKLS